jgi:DNA-binding NarL/FixJ family response regulator
VTTPIRVLLADDHTLVRAGIRSLLEGLGDVQVVAEAGDGRSALELTESTKPDLVLMDVSMPGLNGLESLARIVQDYPKVRVVMLSMHATEEYVLKALRAGAAGYLLKDADTVELGLAVRAVAQGQTYVSPPISKHLVDYVQRTGGEPSSLERLTSRQREILQLVAEGRTTHEIALILNISVKTVETHRGDLMERLGLYDVPGLVRYAIRMGLVSADR